MEHQGWESKDKDLRDPHFVLLSCCVIRKQSLFLYLLFIFFCFGSQISLVLALERKQEKNCTFCLPISITINLTCVQTIAIPTCSIHNSPTLQLQFLVHKSISV